MILFSLFSSLLIVVHCAHVSSCTCNQTAFHISVFFGFTSVHSTCSLHINSHTCTCRYFLFTFEVLELQGMLVCATHDDGYSNISSIAYHYSIDVSTPTGGES